MRDAVLTRSPATMPCPSAPIVTAASPVSTPARARSCGARLVAERGDGGDEVERRAYGALGVVLGRGRRAPDRHHRVADELLDRAAVELDQPSARVEVAREQLAHLLRVARLGERREADEVGEEHGDEAALGRRSLAWRDRWLSPPRRELCRTRRRSARPASCGAPQDGQASASAVPHSTQNFAPGWFSVVHDGQIIRASLNAPPCPRLALSHGRPHGTGGRAGALLPRDAGASVRPYRLQRPQAGGGRWPQMKELELPFQLAEEWRGVRADLDAARGDGTCASSSRSWSPCCRAGGGAEARARGD